MKKHIFKAGDRVLVVKSDSDNIPKIKAMLNLEFTVEREGWSDDGGIQHSIAIKDLNGFEWYFDSDELKLISPEAEKISAILHRAADEHLRTDEEWGVYGKSAASCIAIWYAISAKTPYSGYDYSDSKRNPEFLRVMRFLDKVCGLSEKMRRNEQFGGFCYYNRQQVRYTWLKACAMLAEEYNQ
jgi:hypothetical protein